MPCCVAHDSRACMPHGLQGMVPFDSSAPCPPLPAQGAGRRTLLEGTTSSGPSRVSYPERDYLTWGGRAAGNGMFSIDQFIESCRTAVATADAEATVERLVAEAVSDPVSVVRALREPEHAGFEVL